MFDIIHITKKAYEFYKEKNRPGTVWIDTTTQTIHIDGGGMTIAEVYSQVQQLVNEDQTLTSPFEVKKQWKQLKKI